MPRDLRRRIPNRKTDEEIAFYLENGSKFGSILKQMEELIRNRNVWNFDQAKKYFTKQCIDTWGKDNYVKFPFISVENFDGELFDQPICISVNDNVAHGQDQKWYEKDIVSVDCGVAIKFNNKYLNFDSAFTTQMGGIRSPWIYGPLNAIKSVSQIEIDEVLNTKKIAFEVEKSADEQQLQVVVSIVGHGIGKKLHEPPDIHNALGNFSNKVLTNNMCFCVEPVFVLPAKNNDMSTIAYTYIDSDGWSLKTTSGQPGSHFETMFCIYNNRLVDLVGISKWEPILSKEE